MQITFDTINITDEEVRGLFALLDTVRPSAFDSAEDVTRAVKFDADEVNSVLEGKLGSGGEIASALQSLSDATGGYARTEVTSHGDSTGLPWDERIHASSKALNADGTWRTKRGVDKALVAQVEAELRQKAETRVEVEDEPEASDESDPAGRIEAAQSVAVPPAPPAPEAPPAPLAPAVTQSAPADTVVTTPSAPVAPSSAVSPFVALMKRVTTAQGAGKLTQPRVKELLESLDKKSIMDLRTDDDALASFAVLLDGEGV